MEDHGERPRTTGRLNISPLKSQPAAAFIAAASIQAFYALGLVSKGTAAPTKPVAAEKSPEETITNLLRDDEEVRSLSSDADGAGVNTGTLTPAMEDIWLDASTGIPPSSLTSPSHSSIRRSFSFQFSESDLAHETGARGGPLSATATPLMLSAAGLGDPDAPIMDEAPAVQALADVHAQLTAERASRRRTEQECDTQLLQIEQLQRECAALQESLQSVSQRAEEVRGERRAAEKTAVRVSQTAMTAFDEAEVHLDNALATYRRGASIVPFIAAASSVASKEASGKDGNNGIVPSLAAQWTDVQTYLLSTHQELSREREGRRISDQRVLILARALEALGTDPSALPDLAALLTTSTTTTASTTDAASGSLTPARRGLNFTSTSGRASPMMPTAVAPATPKANLYRSVLAERTSRLAAAEARVATLEAVVAKQASDFRVSLTVLEARSESSSAKRLLTDGISAAEGGVKGVVTTVLTAVTLNPIGGGRGWLSTVLLMAVCSGISYLVTTAVSG